MQREKRETICRPSGFEVTKPSPNRNTSAMISESGWPIAIWRKRDLRFSGRSDLPPSDDDDDIVDADTDDKYINDGHKVNDNKWGKL